MNILRKYIITLFILVLATSTVSIYANLGLFHLIAQFKPVKLECADAVFLLGKKGLKHILSRHHPRYWDGSIKARQSFFRKQTKVNDIIKVATTVINQNRRLILTLKDNKKFQVAGAVNGVQYVLGMKNGKVGQLYPVLK